ncbi:hypothetical protein KQX54_019844 [Cotesia glomerata]|uniref:Uncharacterized protein n=1 Tax=Cotesia glomerata TaxID=32391 RepID=A0AAV7IK94_COTGL|nr:hypothetical protein KQX54_019844 [Cotesia glomerata]
MTVNRGETKECPVGVSPVTSWPDGLPISALKQLELDLKLLAFLEVVGALTSGSASNLLSSSPVDVNLNREHLCDPNPAPRGRPAPRAPPSRAETSVAPRRHFRLKYFFQTKHSHPFFPFRQIIRALNENPPCLSLFADKSLALNDAMINGLPTKLSAIIYYATQNINLL